MMRVRNYGPCSLREATHRRIPLQPRRELRVVFFIQQQPNCLSVFYHSVFTFFLLWRFWGCGKWSTISLKMSKEKCVSVKQNELCLIFHFYIVNQKSNIQLIINKKKDFGIKLFSISISIHFTQYTFTRFCQRTAVLVVIFRSYLYYWYEGTAAVSHVHTGYR